MKPILGLCAALLTVSALAVEPAGRIEEAGISGGLIAQAGSEDLGLAALGPRFHVRLLAPDEAAAIKAQAAIDGQGLQGRFTVAVWDGKRLPFAERVLNALVVARDGVVSDDEARRVLSPRGLLIVGDRAVATPVPDTIDEWTHYLYDASGNAVSKDQEVASPVSLRWWASPLHLLSHNYSSSFTGLVTAGGRVFYLLNEASPLFDKGGATEPWFLVARDAFNGAFLWKVPLEGYGQPFFEDVNGQAVPDHIWRTPLSMNRRVVARGGRVYAALGYRNGSLSVLDAASGKLLHGVDAGGIVDEIVADGDTVICRVRSEIPPAEFTSDARKALAQQLKKQGMADEQIKQEPNRRIFEGLTKQKTERVVAVDAAKGAILWRHDAPHVAVQSLAMAGGKVVYHNYEALIALDAKTGEPAWEYPCPAAGAKHFGIRNMIGNLLIADGKVLWTSGTTGGGVCLDLGDGKPLWTNPRLGTTGGFAFPTALRAIGRILYNDMGGATSLKDGSPAALPDLGGMLKRGHHIRCYPGKATERFLITPHRGAEFIDLKGDASMVNDWLRGACSLGNLPANGLFYVTPDPCSCYAGARIYGFSALGPGAPEGLAGAPAAEAPSRLAKGGAFGAASAAPEAFSASDWPVYRHDARRTGRASTALDAKLQTLWSAEIGGELTQATLAGGCAYLVRKDTYELRCVSLTDGKTLWKRSFPAALDGPPTIVTGGPDTRHPTPASLLFLGCRDGRVYCLLPADGALVWSFLAAPLDRLTLSGDRIENVWPVSSSVLFHNGLVYAVAGRSSYLDGGIHVYALDPATGAVRHYRRLEGPRPDEKTLKTPVLTERDVQAAGSDPAKKAQAAAVMESQYATGYNVQGAEADLLVTDGTDLYMLQTKLTPALDPVPLHRVFHTGLTPMGGMHLMANTGFLDDTLFHRAYRMYDESWPGYGGGSGWAARAGTVVTVGETQAYAAKHHTGGWYPTHEPGTGNRLVADGFGHKNTSGALADAELNRKFQQYGNAGEVVRTAAPNWETTVPIIVRAMLVAPAPGPSTGSGQAGGELVFSAGAVEGKTRAEWDKSTRFEGPGRLLVHDGAAGGKLLAEYDLPACPVFDGLSAADGKILVSCTDGRLVCLGLPR